MAANLVPGYRHVPGNHCGSTALRNLLAFHGLEMSEEMALGLGAGISFYYVALEGSSPSRFTNGRTGRLEDQFVELTGAPLRLETFGDPDAAWDAARSAIDSGRPAILITDLYYLDHYGSSAHFPGHAVVLAGYVLRGRISLRHRVRRAPDDSARGAGPGAPRRSPGVPARRPHVHGPRRIGGSRSVGRRARGDRARCPRDARARAGRLPGTARAPPVRCGGWRLAGGSRGLPVVRAFPLPGDRAPRYRRQQLQAHVLALPRGGRIRGGGPRRRGGRSLELPRGGSAGSERTGGARPRALVKRRRRSGLGPGDRGAALGTARRLGLRVRHRVRGAKFRDRRGLVELARAATDRQ